MALHSNNARVLQDFVMYRLCNRLNPFPNDAYEALSYYIEEVHKERVNESRIEKLSAMLHEETFDNFIDSIGNSVEMGYGWTNSAPYHAPCTCSCRNNRIGLETKNFTVYPDHAELEERLPEKAKQIVIEARKTNGWIMTSKADGAKQKIINYGLAKLDNFPDSNDKVWRLVEFYK